MATSWRITKSGTLEIIDRQGLVGKLFGGFMLCIAGYFLYCLGNAIVAYFRFATLRDIIDALPGMAVTLFMAALFGVPSILMGFLKKRTLCSKANGSIRQVKSFIVSRRIRELRLSDVTLVTSTYRTTKKSNIRNNRSDVPVHTVALVLGDNQQMEVAQLEDWRSAVKLGEQLAGYLGVEFREGKA